MKVQIDKLDAQEIVSFYKQEFPHMSQAMYLDPSGNRQLLRSRIDALRYGAYHAGPKWAEGKVARWGHGAMHAARASL